MHLPSFLWLWRIAAWSMGLAITGYILLAITGGRIFYTRHAKKRRSRWLRTLHYGMGLIFVLLLLVLLSIGIIGTLGHFGHLGHSIHLPIGIGVVLLGLSSAWSASRIGPHAPWARRLHVGINGFLFVALVAVGLSGLAVVQKYLP